MDSPIKETAFIENVIEAAKSVFSMMAGMDIENGDISKEDKTRADVTGIIGLSNDRVKGSIAISFPDKVGRKAVSNMLSLKEEEITEEDLKDGIGEITNMIAGEINNRMGNIFRLSLPSVITGKDHIISFSNKGLPMLFQFKITEDEKFYLLSTFEEK